VNRYHTDTSATRRKEWAEQVRRPTSSRPRRPLAVKARICDVLRRQYGQLICAPSLLAPTGRRRHEERALYSSTTPSCIRTMVARGAGLRGQPQPLKASIAPWVSGGDRAGRRKWRVILTVMMPHRTTEGTYWPARAVHRGLCAGCAELAGTPRESGQLTKRVNQDLTSARPGQGLYEHSFRQEIPALDRFQP